VCAGAIRSMNLEDVMGVEVIVHLQQLTYIDTRIQTTLYKQYNLQYKMMQNSVFSDHIGVMYNSSSI
jgi:hypothetical protein